MCIRDSINAMDEMVKKYLDGAEVVYGVRSRRDTDTLFKRFTAEGFYNVMNALGCLLYTSIRMELVVDLGEVLLHFIELHALHVDPRVLLTVCNAGLQAHVPVSYTHLDVYKRQV